MKQLCKVMAGATFFLVCPSLVLTAQTSACLTSNLHSGNIQNGNTGTPITITTVATQSGQTATVGVDCLGGGYINSLTYTGWGSNYAGVNVVSGMYGRGIQAAFRDAYHQYYNPTQAGVEDTFGVKAYVVATPVGGSGSVANINISPFPVPLFRNGITLPAAAVAADPGVHPYIPAKSLSGYDFAYIATSDTNLVNKSGVVPAQNLDSPGFDISDYTYLTTTGAIESTALAARAQFKSEFDFVGKIEDRTSLLPDMAVPIFRVYSEMRYMRAPNDNGWQNPSASNFFPLYQFGSAASDVNGNNVLDPTQVEAFAPTTGSTPTGMIPAIPMYLNPATAITLQSDDIVGMDYIPSMRFLNTSTGPNFTVVSWYGPSDPQNGTGTVQWNSFNLSPGNDLSNNDLGEVLQFINGEQAAPPRTVGGVTGNAPTLTPPTNHVSAILSSSTDPNSPAIGFIIPQTSPVNEHPIVQYDEDTSGGLTDLGTYPNRLQSITLGANEQQNPQYVAFQDTLRPQIKVSALLAPNHAGTIPTTGHNLIEAIRCDEYLVMGTLQQVEAALLALENVSAWPQ